MIKPSITSKIPRPSIGSISENLLYAMVTGGRCLGYEQITIDDSGAVKLNVPEKAVIALLSIESSETATNKDLVLRYREDSIPPTSSVGMPLGDGTVFEIKDSINLVNTSFIGVEAGLSHKLNIQYYG